MKRKSCVFILGLALALISSGGVLAKEVKGPRPLTYKDLGQALYELVYEKKDQEIEKLGQASHESPGLAWLKALSLVDDKIKEEDNVLRIQGIYILHGLYQRMGDSPSEVKDPSSTFKDVKTVGLTYRLPLAWVEKKGLFIGNEHKKICPHQPLTQVDLNRVLDRGKDLFKDKKVRRPIYFNPYEIERIEVRTASKPGQCLSYTGPVPVDSLRRILNQFEGIPYYKARDQWTNQVRVYTRSGSRYDYYIFHPVFQSKGLVFESAQNKITYGALEGYLLKS